MPGSAFDNSLRLQIVSVSNSRTQREFIEGEAQRRNFNNLTVITCDINNLNADVLGLVASSSGATETKGAPASGGKGKKKGGEAKNTAVLSIKPYRSPL